eukprot:2769162-Rhodomonas_salina.6
MMLPGSIIWHPLDMIDTVIIAISGLKKTTVLFETRIKLRCAFLHCAMPAGAARSLVLTWHIVTLGLLGARY